MSHSRRFAAAMVIPPVVVALPISIAFIARVTRMPSAILFRYVAITAAAYAIGAFIAAARMSREMQRVEKDLAAGRDPSESVSHALTTTTFAGALVWICWGGIISMTACALLARTFLGVQYFSEAALLVAAPAMAWTYWTGKRLLLRAVADVPRLEYTGRVWSIGAKIAIVFIGFFVAAAGALVLVISSRVSARLGVEAAAEVGRFGLFVAIVTAAIFAIATWYLTQDISKSMTELVRMTGEMAEGRFGGELRIFADDEIGKLARSFGVTRQNLRMLVGRVGDRGQVITGGVRMMTLGTESLVTNAHEQSGMAEQSSSALNLVQGETQSVLREVNRVAELTLDSAARATELRASFAEVAQRMDELFQSVEKSSSASSQIDAAARETVRRTAALAGMSHDVLSFVAQLDATGVQIMHSAQSTAALSDQVRSNAVAGRAAVEATLEGIHNAQESTRRTAGAFESLQKSLGQIDQILLFIDEVTNRTNLLSLNAAIVAAQAGQQDYGFTVIADEIRQLADRTRTATKEIAGIIRGLRPVTHQAVEAIEEGVKYVDRTVELANDASAALKTILGSADRSLEMTRSISQALEEQSKGSGHLHVVTASMSDNITEMQRATEGQAEATRLLAVESERVTDIALQVKRATSEQNTAGEGIAAAMEQIAGDVRTIRDRLDRQLHQAEQIASASRVTLKIAERNNMIAEEFRASLQSLVQSGSDFDLEVARFRDH